MSITTFIDENGHGVSRDRLTGLTMEFYEETVSHEKNMAAYKLIREQLDDPIPSLAMFCGEAGRLFPEPATGSSGGRK